MKIPKRISEVISSVRSQKKLPVFIYNTPEELKQQIVTTLKKSVIIDSANVHSSYHMVAEAAKQLKVETRSTNPKDPSMFVRIEAAIGDRVVVLLKPEFLALTAYSQISTFVNAGIPVIVISSYEGFIERFRHTKYYADNVFIEIDCKEL